MTFVRKINPLVVSRDYKDSGGWKGDGVAESQRPPPVQLQLCKWLRGSIGNYFKRKLDVGTDGSSEGSSKRNSSNEVPQRPQPTTVSPTPMASIPTTINMNDLPSDLTDRPKITSYHPNQKDEIRRAYCIKGPCQPRGHTFPSKKIGPKLRRFIVEWFDEFDWLEYSIKEDKAYCLCCYLFGDIVGQQGGRDAFVTEGFSTWSKKKSLYAHVGNVDSLCNIPNYRFLLENKLPFHGHDESDDSISKGLFIETLSLIREHNESIYNVTLEKAPKNDKLTSPKIQKDIVECFSKEIIKSICDEIGKDVFAILVDESSDVSKKEQMAMVLRYVDRLGVVKEIFIGVVHVTDTSSLTLKAAIDSVFTDNKLSMAQVRGQGYDGASNMCSEFNGLKALILRDNKSTYYVHCFAHQLQLVIVAVAKSHDGAHEFFEQLALVVNVVCASCKRKDIIRESYKKRLKTEIGIGETETGRGLNQELYLIRAGDTRWGSHYKTIISLMNLFPEVIEVLKYVEEDGSTLSNRNQVYGLTDTLSRHLQRKDQDILEAASLVRATKKSLQTLRNDSIETLDMSEYYVTPRNRRTKITNQHHFEVEIFNTVLDMQILEFGDRFSEVSTELLENMAALSPSDSFSKFDKSKLLKLSEMYPDDFSDSERTYLLGQLDIYYHSLLHDDKFANLNGIADLSRLMVETGKHRSFLLIYRLLKLVLVLPVATATVERCFSAMKLLKTDLRNKMSDDFMNHALICAIEKEALLDVKIESSRVRVFVYEKNLCWEIHLPKPGDSENWGIGKSDDDDGLMDDQRWMDDHLVPEVVVENDRWRQ
ncbi:zinc finger MYM-type protein 1-like [Hibiscus syriacus]|uniref:zinc finger MYM-type protein 1-like n=1 Tax=Hibiscus syriacus TaxID=106335 RepID=UPI001921C2AE|nr:zinc finger MYM-type protein 1-like [Hibiscus syriacus]